MNFMVYGIAMLAYWAIGFALQAGGVGALGTLGGYDKLAHEVSITIRLVRIGACRGDRVLSHGGRVHRTRLAYFLFQMVSWTTAATIPTRGVGRAVEVLGVVWFSVFVAR